MRDDEPDKEDEVPDEAIEDSLPEDAPGDILLASGSRSEAGGGLNRGLLDKESAILSDRPLAEFTLPNGKVLKIFAKSEGQMILVDMAFQAYLDTLVVIEKRARKRWWRFGSRQRRIKRWLTRSQLAKAELFRAIFEDQYNEEMHQEFTATDFMSSTMDMQQAIISAYRDANDPSDLIDAMFPEVKKNRIMRQQSQGVMQGSS